MKPLSTRVELRRRWQQQCRRLHIWWLRARLNEARRDTLQWRGIYADDRWIVLAKEAREAELESELLALVSAPQP